jgi:hypothetical protein
MTKNKHCDIHNIIHSIINIKNIIIYIIKNIFTENTSFLFNNMKTYIIFQKKNRTKNFKCVLRFKTRSFGPKNDVMV